MSDEQPQVPAVTAPEVTPGEGVCTVTPGYSKNMQRVILQFEAAGEWKAQVHYTREEAAELAAQLVHCAQQLAPAGKQLVFPEKGFRRGTLKDPSPVRDRLGLKRR